jgi:hypothetical protein
MRCLGRTITRFSCLGLTVVPTYGNDCATGADREDGLFCTRNTCDVGTGTCAMTTTCPAVIKEILLCA